MTNARQTFRIYVSLFLTVRCNYYFFNCILCYRCIGYGEISYVMFCLFLFLDVSRLTTVLLYYCPYDVFIAM